MRFEQKAFIDQIKTLKRLHHYLNRVIFKNALQADIPIDICNINKEAESNFAACFRCNHIFCDEKGAHFGVAILFGRELIYDDIATMKTQKAQIFALGATMLHEMIHQYCYENNLDDTNHGGQWKETAEKFHLISNYEEGEPISEYVTQTGAFIISCFRLR